MFLYKANQEQNFIPSRGITDGKYKIIWNYNTAYLSAGRNGFQWGMPGLRDWEEKYRQGQFKNGYPKYFFEPMVPIEFYDLKADPDETVNLVYDKKMASTIENYKQKLMKVVRETGDMGFFPMSMRDTINTYENLKAANFNLDALVTAAETASLAESADAPKLVITSYSIHYTKLYDSNSAGFFIAILPPVIMAAPLSKAIFRSFVVFRPPPKSIIRLVLFAIRST